MLCNTNLMRTGNVCAIKIVELAGRELYNNLDTTFYHENLNGEYIDIHELIRSQQKKLVQQTSASVKSKVFFIFNAGNVHA